MAKLKPAYLVCGDDDAKIDAWRLRVRRRAEEERGPGGLEGFDARQSDPGEVEEQLAVPLDPGTRYLLVDDVGFVEGRASSARWRRRSKELPPEIVLVFS